MSQIDIEDAIAATTAPPLPTVRQYAERNGAPEWRVRESIRRGALHVDDKKRPMLVIGGEMALSVEDWRAVLMPVLSSIRPTQWSWADNGRRLKILTASATVASFAIPLTRASARMQADEINRLPAKRVA